MPFFGFGSPAFVEGKDPAALVRGVVEAQALSMQHHSRWIGETPSLLLVTGGASRNRGILQVLADVFQAEIRTLKGAEWMGGHVMPTGEALLSGYYVNELQLSLLARDDAHAGTNQHRSGVALHAARPRRLPAALYLPGTSLRLDRRPDI